MTQLSAPVVEVFSSFQGEGLLVGTRQVFVRLAGCSLSCRYCDTAAARRPVETCTVWHDAAGERTESLANPLPAAKLAHVITALAAVTPHHSVSFTGGEPLLHPEYISTVISELGDSGLQTYLDTACCLPEAMAQVAEQIDCVAADYKLPSTIAEPVPFADFAACWQEIRRGRFLKLVVTKAVSPAEMRDFCRPMHELDPDARIVIQPVTPSVPGVEPPSVTELFALVETCAEWFPLVRVIPQTHVMLGVR